MKKVREQNIFGITGSKKHNTYPIFSNEDYGDYGYCILYTGKLDKNDEYGEIIGIDIDDYRDIPIKQKLEELGFDYSVCGNYDWITISAKNGIHIICKWTSNTDITTTNLYHQGKKSCIDMRGTGGKLILAGSKTNIGDYRFAGVEPTPKSKLLNIKTLNPTLYKSITDKVNKNLGGLRNDKELKTELEKAEKYNKKKPNINYIDNPNDFDLEVIRVMLSKLDMNVEHYGEWCRMGMCIHNEFGGNDLGKKLYKEFSSMNYKYDEDYVDNIWDYWTTYDIKEKYPYLNKRIILRDIIQKTDNPNMFNECRKIAKDNIKQRNMDSDSEDSNNTEDIFLSEAYIEYRKNFEENENVWRVGSSFRRLEVNMNGEIRLKTLCKTKLKDLYENLPPIPYIVEGKTKYKSFIQNWIRDPNAKCYYGCGFKPNQPLEFEVNCKGKIYKYCNEFYGFRGAEPYSVSENDRVFMIDTFRKQLKMLCENNDTLLSYCLHFLRKMLLYPEQKSMNVMICFISDFTGLGKTSMIDFIFNDIIGKQYAKTTDKLDKVFSTFSDYRHNKIGFCYNEGELSMTMNKFNLLKGLITDIEDNYEKKYEDSEDSENLLHCFFTSNQLVSLKITETDRRHFVCFGIPIEPMEDFEIQKTNFHKCLDSGVFGNVIFDYLTKDNSWVDKVMGSKYFDYGHNIPMTKAKASIVETFTPIEIQFLKYLCENNFRSMENNMKALCNPMELRSYYTISGNSYGLARDYKLKELRTDNPNCKSYQNEDDRYLDSVNKLEDICINAPILETHKPYYEYANKTPLKNMSIKNKSKTLQKEYCEMLSVDKNYDNFIDNDTDEIFMEIKRNPNNPYIRLEMSYFVWKMNDWRSKTNSTSSKKQLNSIINQFRVDFNRTTNSSIMKIKSIRGKKYISFNKKEVLDRINEKYIFSED